MSIYKDTDFFKNLVVLLQFLCNKLIMSTTKKSLAEKITLEKLKFSMHDKSLPSELYHGTTDKRCRDIIQHGFQVTKESVAGRRFGNGVYATASLEAAAKHANSASCNEKEEIYGVLALQLASTVNLSEIFYFDISAESEAYEQYAGDKSVSMFYYNYLAEKYSEAFSDYASMIAATDPNANSIISYHHISQAAFDAGFKAICYDGTKNASDFYILLINDPKNIVIKALRHTGHSTLTNPKQAERDLTQNVPLIMACLMDDSIRGIHGVELKTKRDSIRRSQAYVESKEFELLQTEIANSPNSPNSPKKPK